MTVVTEVENFEEGSPFDEITTLPPNTTVPFTNSDRVHFVAPPSLGEVAAGSLDAVFAILTQTFSYSHVGTLTLHELWEAHFADFYPDYDEFVDLVVSVFGSEEAGAESLNTTYATFGYLPMQSITCRSYVTPGVSTAGFASTSPILVTVVPRAHMADASPSDPDQTRRFALSNLLIDPKVDGEYHAEFTFYEAPGGDGGTHISTGVDVPLYEWMICSVSIEGLVLTGEVRSETGVLLVTHDWDLTGMEDPVILTSDCYVTAGDNTVNALGDPVDPFPAWWYVDDITWVHEIEEVAPVPVPPVAPLVRNTRMYPVHI